MGLRHSLCHPLNISLFLVTVDNPDWYSIPLSLIFLVLRLTRNSNLSAAVPKVVVDSSETKGSGKVKKCYPSNRTPIPGFEIGENFPRSRGSTPKSSRYSYSKNYSAFRTISWKQMCKTLRTLLTFTEIIQGKEFLKVVTNLNPKKIHPKAKTILTIVKTKKKFSLPIKKG